MNGNVDVEIEVPGPRARNGHETPPMSRLWVTDQSQCMFPCSDEGTLTIPPILVGLMALQSCSCCQQGVRMSAFTSIVVTSQQANTPFTEISASGLQVPSSFKYVMIPSFGHGSQAFEWPAQAFYDCYSGLQQRIHTLSRSTGSAGCGKTYGRKFTPLHNSSVLDS